MTKGWRLTLWITAGLLAAAIAVGGFVGYRAWRLIHDPFRGYTATTKVIDVPRGTDARQILSNLQAEGVIADARLARLYLIYQLKDPFLKAGEYRFEGPLTTPEVLAKLIRGEVVTYPITIIEGLTLQQTVERLALTDFGQGAEFEALVRSPERIRDLDSAASDLEGYLFPETYQFARGTSPDEIIGTMVSTFRRRYESEVAPLVDLHAELSVRDIVTLASIVETEAQLDEERPIIAGVYANRLRIGMPLQADPTVIYSLTLAGTYDGNLRREDLKFDSPYNTYVHAGLPPGPIASPGLASLQAAARPADVPYLYFVSRNDGSHVFAETLREHNRNVHEWQKLYWRRKWAEERRQE
jgi:UPF0755 protein